MIVLIIIYVIGLFFFVLHESKSIYEDLAMDITNVSDDNCIKRIGINSLYCRQYYGL